MKIKALSRPITSVQTPGSDATKAPRNLSSAAHPFERGREYVRALNAVKLERHFAAPFVGQLGDGHVDGVYQLAKDPNSLKRFASGSGDGVIKTWDLTTRKETWTATAHEGIVKGMTWTKDSMILSCAADRTIKLWNPSAGMSEASDGSKAPSAPIASWLGSNAFTSLSTHRSHHSFAASTGAPAVEIYDLNRPTAAPEVLRWPTSHDTISHVTWNPVETSILGSCSTDRSIVMYDVRQSMPLTKTTLNFAVNRLAFNPMEAMNLAACSEDHNVYIFDMRKFDRALNVLKGHVAAVMDVDFSPTGQDLVTASYDRTVRLWSRDQGHSRDVYHTKRMQRVFAARFTPDAKYVLSGSDDGNVRIWRADASARAGVRSARQRQALEYNRALVDRYAHVPEIRRIRRHRHVPQVIKRAGEIKKEELAAIKRREENERKHTTKQFEKRASEREKMVLAREK